MTEAVATPKKNGMQITVMIISFLLALPLSGVLLVNPALMLDSNGHYNHSVLMLVMIGISGGFIYGVGFIPRFWLWKWLFSPFIAWPLMLIGYYLWFFN